MKDDKEGFSAPVTAISSSLLPLNNRTKQPTIISPVKEIVIFLRDLVKPAFKYSAVTFNGCILFFSYCLLKQPKVF